MMSTASVPKIAYIMSRFPKLTETFILYEILALEKLGVSVEVYPLLRTHQSVTHPEAEAMVKRAHFHSFLSWSILYANWYFIRHSPRAYMRVWMEALRGTWGSINFFIGALGILPKTVCFAYEMRRAGITHVHAHFATHPALAGLIIYRLTGIPFSFVAHGSDLHVDRRMLDRKIATAAFTITVSAYNKALMVQECGEEMSDKIHIIHCGIDPTVFVSHRKHCTGKPFRILCVGSFEEVKGHTYLIEACRILRDRGIEVSCHLVGDGPRRRALEAQIQQGALQHQVQIHGGLPRAGVVAMLKQADVVVLASVPTSNGKREGIPVSLMEAMACAVPVISSDMASIPELVESGRNGLLVPPRDANALADTLQILRDDEVLRTQLGRAGRETVLQDFNLHKNTLALLQLCQKDAHHVEDPHP